MKAMAEKAATALERSGVLRALESVDRSTDLVRVVAYHRVDDHGAEPDLDPGLLSATPAVFREQMELVAKHYSAISIDDLVAAHRGNGTLPSRAVLLTFDDGYVDFEKNAWPILRELGLPAALFVPTAFPDNPGPGFWWDRLHAALTRTQQTQLDVEGVGEFDLSDEHGRRTAHRVIRTRAKMIPHGDAMKWLDGLIEQLADVPPIHRVCGWDALRKMAAEGLSVCSHGNLHALVNRLTPEELVEDLSVSKQRIETELGDAAPPPVFAYPAGGLNRRTIAAVGEAGYELAFGGGRGVDRLPLQHPLRLFRIPVHRYGTPLFRAQLRPNVARLGGAVQMARARRSA